MIEYNSVTLIGKMVSKRSFSHTVDFENFYQFDLEVTRLNGAFEVFPIIASERIMYAGFDIGNVVKIQGKFQTEKSFINDKTKFVIYATTITLHTTEVDYLEANSVMFDGVICRKPNYRVSHFGKGHCDALLAVKRNEEDSDFIPCIAFGATAKILQKLKVGQKVKIFGRIKSKPHEKKIESSISEINKMYEILVTKVETFVGENEIKPQGNDNSFNNSTLEQSRPNVIVDNRKEINNQADANTFKDSKLDDGKSNTTTEVKNKTIQQVDNNLFSDSKLNETQPQVIVEDRKEIKNSISDSMFNDLKINTNNMNTIGEARKKPIFSYNYTTIRREETKAEKTEKEKMLAGEIYDANHDEKLIKERQTAQELCYEYNSFKPSNMFWRKEHMKKILGKVKGEFLIEQPFMCDYGYNIEIGENFYANHNLIILDAGKVKFGDNVFIGPNCAFYTAEHPIDAETRNKGLEYAKPIEIGNNVWIGGNVVVLSGVKIGDNSVIGAGSVVTKDIPSGSVAVGNPCRVIKKVNE